MNEKIQNLSTSKAYNPNTFLSNPKTQMPNYTNNFYIFAVKYSEADMKNEKISNLSELISFYNVLVLLYLE